MEFDFEYRYAYNMQIRCVKLTDTFAEAHYGNAFLEHLRPDKMLDPHGIPTMNGETQDVQIWLYNGQSDINVTI